MAKVMHLHRKPETPGLPGLPKQPSDEVMVTVQGVEGDYNKYRTEKKAKDPNMALLIMPLEAIAQLNSEGWPVKPGDLGENITTQGIPYEELGIGKQYKIGEAVVEIAKVCDPCTKLYVLPYVGMEKGHQFIKTMLNRRGWYARVLTPGRIRIEDPIDRFA